MHAMIPTQKTTDPQPGHQDIPIWSCTASWRHSIASHKLIYLVAKFSEVVEAEEVASGRYVESERVAAVVVTCKASVLPKVVVEEVGISLFFSVLPSLVEAEALVNSVETLQQSQLK